MEENKMEERRKSFRFPTNLKASCYLREEKESLEKCNILNVSYTGIGVKFYTLEKIKTGSKIHLEIISERQLTPISVTGILRWIGGGGFMPFVGGLELAESLESLQLIKLF
jgi:hypothetical protein